jgi:kynurenine formamidase
MRPDLVKEYEAMVGKPVDEALPMEYFEYVHYKTARNDVCMLENLGGDLAAVAGRRVTMGAFPWRWIGGEGCVCRVVAFVED